MNRLLLLFLAGAFASGGAHSEAADTTTLKFTTLAGQAGAVVKSTDGTGSAAEFYLPRGVAVDSAGNVYVAGSSNHTIRKVTPAGVVTTLAGAPGIAGPAHATPAQFNEPFSVAVDSGGTVYVADTNNNAIRKISAAGVVSTLAGGEGMGSADGIGAAARFAEPRGIALDSSGNVYVADYGANVIHRVTAAGVITKVAGTAPIPGSTDGVASALFNRPSGLAVDSANNLVIADTSNSTIRKVTSGGAVTTLAGLAGRSASADGIGAAARFEDPNAVATDGTHVYVADATDHTIRRIAADGTTTTLAGKAGSFGSTDGAGANARFNGPMGIAADSGGTVYVADSGNRTVRKITAAGVVTTLAGTAGTSGSRDGTGAAALFHNPTGIAVDGSGNVYVADMESATLRKITPAGEVSTIAGSGIGSVDAPGTAASFYNPKDVAADASGNVYVADRSNHTVRKGTPIATGLAAASPYSGLWWKPSESGWGMSITQHDNVNFIAIYTYDPGAQPAWYVMPGCPVVTAASCSSDIYKVTGGTQPVVPWNGTGRVITRVGSGTLTFSDANHGVFAFTLDGIAGSRTIERQRFSNGTTAQAVDYTDLWWNAAESGWGVALTQDAGMIFATWFAYDASGNPVWYVASSCPLLANGCTGDLYKVTGGAPLTSPWAASPAAVKVGTVTFAFGGVSSATMSYTVNGVAGSRGIVRQAF